MRAPPPRFDGRLHLLLTLLLGFLSMAPSTLRGAAFAVNTLTDTQPTGGGAGSGAAGDLRYCIGQANGAGGANTITFGVTGTITLAGQELSISSDLTLTGPGPESLGIDANHASRVFFIQAGHMVALSGVTLANGNGSGNDSAPAGHGGCLLNDGSAVQLTNCAITGGRSSLLSLLGGGIYNGGETHFATLTVDRCDIGNNSSSAGGGGIFNAASAALTVSHSTVHDNFDFSEGGGIANVSYRASSSVTVTDSSILNNRSATGGGLTNNGESGDSGTARTYVATMTLTNCVISGNQSTEDRDTGSGGGGIRNEDLATLAINNCTISGNSAVRFGGGIHNVSQGNIPIATLRNSTVSGNDSSVGGGIANLGNTSRPAQLTLAACTLCANTASGRGGGVYSQGGATAVFNNATVCANVAPGGGGGVANDSSTLTLTNTILAQNSSGANYASTSGRGVSGGYNLVDDPSGAAFLTAAGDLSNTPAGLQTDGNGQPLLQANGGPTATVALLSSSLAVDAGKSAGDLATGQPATADQRGFARPARQPGNAGAQGGDGSDIGAFEFGSSPILQTIEVDQPNGAPLVSGTGAVSLGPVAVSGSKTLTFTVFDRGLADLSGLALSVTGANAGEFQPGALGAASLPYGTNTTFTVTFSPQASGGHTATVHLASNDPATPSFDISLTGTVPAPQPVIAVAEPVGTPLVAGSAAIDFGAVSTGMVKSLTVAVSNTGSANLTGLAISVTGLNAADFKINAPGSSTLAPGAGTTFNVTFAPTGGDTRSAVLHVASTDPSTPSFDINLTGKNPFPAPVIIVAEPVGTPLAAGSGVDFGMVSVGARQSLTFGVSNSGSAALAGLSILATGDDAAEFEVGSPDRATLAPGESASFTVTFAPTAYVAHTATLHVTGHDPSAPSFDIPLTGANPVPPTIDLRQADGTTLSAGTGTVAFSSFPLGGSGSTNLTVHNAGSVDLTGLSWSISGPAAGAFRVDVPASTSLPPSQSAQFAVSFAPTSAGPCVATMHVASNDPRTPTFDVNLNGTGLTTVSKMAGTYSSEIGNGRGALTVTVLGDGQFSGQARYGGATYALRGTLDASGYYSGAVGHPPLPIVLQLGLGTAASSMGDLNLTGSVGPDSFAAYHTAYLPGQMATESGRYTFLIRPTAADPSSPQGVGYGLMVVSHTGAVTQVGRLADGSIFSSAGVVVGAGDGTHAFVVKDSAIYGGKGLIAGPAAFDASTDDAFDGLLRWSKSAATVGNYYRAGFDTLFEIIGSRYRAPAVGNMVLPLAGGAGNAALQIAGGGLTAQNQPAPLSATATLSPRNLVSIVGANPQRLKLVLYPGTGLFTGSFLHPVSHRETLFSGALYQNASDPQAGGYFLGPVLGGAGKSGSVTLNPSSSSGAAAQ